MDQNYRHTQIGWVIIITVSIIIIYMIPFMFIDKLILYIFLGISFFCFLLLLIFGTLTITVTEEYLKLFFGIGIIHKKIKLTSIKEFREVKNSWMLSWGIRYYGEGFFYNVSGLKAVELFLENGKKLRIGTDEPEKLGAALKNKAIINKEPETIREREKSFRKGLIMIAIILILTFGFIIGLLAYGSAPLKIFINNDLIQIKGMYGTDIEAKNIKEIILADRIPRILIRTNGYALGGVLKGHFKLEEIGTGRLFFEEVRSRQYLVFYLNESFIIINFKDVNKTREFFNELKESQDFKKFIN